MISHRKNRNAALLCMMFAIGLLYYVNYHIAIPPTSEGMVNSRSLPNLLGCGILAMGALLGLLSWRGAREEAAAPRERDRNARTVTLFALVFAFYVVLIPWLGFFTASFLFLLCTLRAFQVRWRLAVPVAVLAVAALYCLFVRFMHVPLPTGWLW